MATVVASKGANDMSASPTRSRRFRRWLAALVAVLALADFVAVTGRLFVWPRVGMPPQVSAIVVLGGAGNRLDTAISLARDHRAPYLVISRGSPYWGQGSRCGPPIAGVTVICFDPDPSSTQGEAEAVGRLAREFHWQSLVLVTTPDQDTRGRIRVGRCFAGAVYAVTTPLPSNYWAWAVIYEWGALLKAELWQRAC
jgi:hypothetical protein